MGGSRERHARHARAYSSTLTPAVPPPLAQPAQHAGAMLPLAHPPPHAVAARAIGPTGYLACCPPLQRLGETGPAQGGCYGTTCPPADCVQIALHACASPRTGPVEHPTVLNTPCSTI